jgi:hypothetical protein
MLSARLTVHCGIAARSHGCVGLNMDMCLAELKHQCDGLDVQAIRLAGERLSVLLAMVCMELACMSLN